MSIKHTPGPWAPAPLSPFDILGPDETMIAMAREGLNGISREQAVANARLIAAAPELLSNLENLIRLSIWKSASDYDRAQLQLAVEAVQKAKGQTSE